GAGADVRWRDDAPEGLLHFERPGFACTVNTTDAAVCIPAPGSPLLASAPVDVVDGAVELPADTTVWWAV
ncbi:alpha-glucosidase, partial [Streptomyces sp. NPDC006552]